MDLAKKTSEKRQVLGALRDVQTIQALRLVSKYVAVKGLTEEAGSAAVRIADRAWKRDKDLARKTMLAVVENVRSKRTKNDARKVLGKIGPAPK
jgi:ribosome maturation protein Sdo1